jgi:hypothetical protein
MVFGMAWVGGYCLCALLTKHSQIWRKKKKKKAKKKRNWEQIAFCPLNPQYTLHTLAHLKYYVYKIRGIFGIDCDPSHSSLLIFSSDFFVFLFPREKKMLRLTHLGREAARPRPALFRALSAQVRAACLSLPYHWTILFSIHFKPWRWVVLVFFFEQSLSPFFFFFAGLTIRSK